jgi:CysZ protein
MQYVLRSIPIALNLIVRDPINLFLALTPTIIALAIYIILVFGAVTNMQVVISLFQDYLPTADHATLLAKMLTALLVILIFFIMSWTFVVVVGILAAPFNSILSSRIEKKLLKEHLSSSRQDEMKRVSQGIVGTLLNELKKLILIIFVSLIAIVLNFFPLLYPVGIFLFSLLLAIQFLDFSWSRHEMRFSQCFKDVLSNIFVYAGTGFVFLLLITIPLVNALIPAFATSYFTVLWTHRNYHLN